MHKQTLMSKTQLNSLKKLLNRDMFLHNTYLASPYTMVQSWKYQTTLGTLWPRRTPSFIFRKDSRASKESAWLPTGIYKEFLGFLLFKQLIISLYSICLYTIHTKITHQNSAWFNGAVTVQIVRNIPTSTDLSNIGTNRNGTILRRYNREVNLCCKGKVLCNATSDVVISDNKVVDLIENEGVGIGQLFR